MAQDFINKTFTKVLRGYAPEEVDEYIEKTAEECRRAEKRASENERRLAIALKKLDEVSLELQRTCERNEQRDKKSAEARDLSEKIIIEAKQCAERILADAKSKADDMSEKIIADAHEAAGRVIDRAEEKAKNNYTTITKMNRVAVKMCDEITSFHDMLFDAYTKHIESIESITESAQDLVESVDGIYLSDTGNKTVTIPAAVSETEGDEGDTDDGEGEVISQSDADASYDADNTDDGGDTGDGDIEQVGLGSIFTNSMLFADENGEDDVTTDAVDAPEEDEEADTVDDIADESDDDSGEDIDTADSDEDDDEDDGLGDIFAGLMKTFDDETKSVALDEPDTEEPEPDEGLDFQEDADTDADLELDKDFELEKELNTKNDEFDFGIELESDEDLDFDKDTKSGYEEETEDYEEEAGSGSDFDAPEKSAPESTEDDELMLMLKRMYSPAQSAADIEKEKNPQSAPDGTGDFTGGVGDDNSFRDYGELTDEFDIVFSRSDYKKNVDEIMRQPTVPPETPTNPKKHSKF